MAATEVSAAKVYLVSHGVTTLSTLICLTMSPAWAVARIHQLAMSRIWL